MMYTPNDGKSPKRRRPSPPAEPSSAEPSSAEPATWYGRLLLRFAVWYDGLASGGKLRVEINGTVLLKALTYGALIVCMAVMQTTVFTRFRPFGAVPDLMLTLVIAISMTEGGKWGAVLGIAAGYLIDALGGTGLALSPLLCMMAGYLCGILTVYYLTNSLPVWGVYMGAAAAVRAVATLIQILSRYDGYPLNEAFAEIILPEMGSTLLLSLFTLGAARLAGRPFRQKKRRHGGENVI